MEYQREKPEISRIQRLRSHPYDSLAALIGPLTFLLTGSLILCLRFLQHFLPVLLLLRNGQEASGKVKQIDAVESGIEGFLSPPSGRLQP